MKTAFQYRYILASPIFEYECLVWALNIKEGTRKMQRALMSNHCLLSHCWYAMEKLTVAGSSNLKAQCTKICLKKMKEKPVLFTKGKSKFLQNQRGEGDFSVENLGLFFQSSGNIKQEITIRNWTHKLPHKLVFPYERYGTFFSCSLILLIFRRWWFLCYE